MDKSLVNIYSFIRGLEIWLYPCGDEKEDVGFLEPRSSEEGLQSWYWERLKKLEIGANHCCWNDTDRSKTKRHSLIPSSSRIFHQQILTGSQSLKGICEIRCAEFQLGSHTSIEGWATS